MVITDMEGKTLHVQDYRKLPLQTIFQSFKLSVLLIERL